jgi:AraC-like DNA-binding protein
VPAGLNQDLHKAPEEVGLTKMYLRFQLQNPQKSLHLPSIPTVIHLPSAAALLSQVVREHQHQRPDSRQRIKALLVLLFSDLNRALISVGGLSEERRGQLLSLLDEDPQYRWTTKELAERLGISALHLCRQVHKHFGCSLRRLIVEHRIRAAAGELTQGMSISAVAKTFGYEDPFLFSRQFRQILGQSPSAWRDAAFGRQQNPRGTKPYYKGTEKTSPPSPLIILGVSSRLRERNGCS